MTKKERPRFTVWITKYALTEGIFIREVEHCTDIADDMVSTIPNDGSYQQHFHGEGKDWHRTEGSAIERAEIMRRAKISSLQKSIVKMQGLSFT